MDSGNHTVEATTTMLLWVEARVNRREEIRKGLRNCKILDTVQEVYLDENKTEVVEAFKETSQGMLF